MFFISIIIIIIDVISGTVKSEQQNVSLKCTNKTYIGHERLNKTSLFSPRAWLTKKEITGLTQGPPSSISHINQP